MTKVGSIIEGKYEILKEIGRGGMSVVYLANDTHVNRNWAVKEVTKKGEKNSEIVVNSLLVEANMVKRLDHPALPRIVDIIDNESSLYIVMDFIEGESLDKVIKEQGAQAEEKVISWALQVCDALLYLHSQNPPIIYRDMKPANLMLKPNGNISIIDFGIAREYKEHNLSDTTVLGTKGYAPPEQYSGQTDPRSDIFALGMTMHHLLTAVDPRSGEAYRSIRQWNPGLSEGMEAIVDKCVEPAAENRYQNCMELLVDLQDPSKVTAGWHKKLKRRLAAFITAISFALVMAVTGTVLAFSAKATNEQDYELKIKSSDNANYYDAIAIYPSRVEAYNKLLEYCKNYQYSEDKDKDIDILKFSNQIENNSLNLNKDSTEIAELYYNAGKLIFAEYGGVLKDRAVRAKNFFDTAANSTANFDKKGVSDCYLSVCKFMTSQSNTTENTLEGYRDILEKINSAIEVVDKLNDKESNYDKISLYYVVALFVNDQARYLAGVNFDKSEILNLLERLLNKSEAITSTLSYVNNLQNKLKKDYDIFVEHINLNYNEVAKRRKRGGM